MSFAVRGGVEGEFSPSTTSASSGIVDGLANGVSVTCDSRSLSARIPTISGERVIRVMITRTAFSIEWNHALSPRVDQVNRLKRGALSKQTRCSLNISVVAIREFIIPRFLDNGLCRTSWLHARQRKVHARGAHGDTTRWRG